MAMPAEPQATTTAGVAPELSAGLRLIALPVVSEEPNAQRVLGFEADKLAVYEPASGYVRYPNVALQVSRGYWVQLPAAQRPNIRGDVPDESQPFTIPLQQGWNLIGNPWLESLSWNLSALQVSLGGQTKSLAEARAAGWLEDYAWTWDGSKYVLIYDNSIVPGVISQLEAWQGCWVYAHQACNLILPAPGETTRQFQVIAEPESGVGLKITSVTATRTRGGAFHITFHLTAPAAVTAEVLNASGKPVAQLNPFGGRAVEGTQSMIWRGTDDSGIALPAGAYLLQLRATDEDGRQTRMNIPLVLTR